MTEVLVSATMRLFEPGTGLLTREGLQFINTLNRAIGEATSEFVRLDATQTLTNKTIDGDSNTIQDVPTAGLKSRTGDGTRVATADTAGTGGNLAEWDADGNVADAGVPTTALVTASSSNTLTNKTIDGDNNTLQDIGTGSLKTKTGNGTRVATSTAAGTSGHLASWDANGNVGDAGAPLSDYLTTADADTTYLTQADAASDYLTQADAATTYLPQSGGTLTGPLILPSYTVGTLPNVITYARGLIYVSDETGGPTLAFSNGANWLRVQDLATVS